MGLSQGGEREREEGRRERKREERSRRGRGSRRSRNMEKDGVGGQHSIFRVQGAWHSHFEDTLKSFIFPPTEIKVFITVIAQGLSAMSM